MGKKVKKKARSGHKEKRVSSASQKIVTQAQQSTLITETETVDGGYTTVKERKVCPHLDKGIDLVKTSSRIGSAEKIRCDDCREGVVDRRTSKGKGKQVKKKGGGSVDTKSENKAIWVCLQCGHFSCGGIGFPITPQSHAVRHARQTRHPLAIQFENLQLRWCFPCNTLIQIDKLEDNGEQKDMLSDIVKLIKGRSSQGASADVEDVWFGSGNITGETKIKSENSDSSSLGGGGYVVRGLVNLGNTCFFNSIMQNLFAMGTLRGHFLKLNEAFGPLTISLKNLYIETSPETGLRNVINPRSLFGCVCAKAPQFRGYQQQDSHEFLRCLLDGLCSEELIARKRSASSENEASPNIGPAFVDAIFGGQLSSTVSCLECRHSSTVFEPFLDLSLPVPTKKSPSKKAQPLSRAKKPKLPPKKSARIRAKANNDADSLASGSVSNLSAGASSSGQGESSVPFTGKVGDALANPALSESADSNIVEDKKNSNLSNALSVEEFVEKPFLENVKDTAEASLDNLTWLDYLEPDPGPNDHNITSKTYENTGIHSLKEKDPFQNDALLKDCVESGDQVSSCNNETVGSVGDVTCFDYIEPGASTDVHGVSSKVDGALVIHDFGNKDSNPNDAFPYHGSGSNKQVSSLCMELKTKVNSPENSFENECLLQVQGSEVILLPYRDETSSSGEVLMGEAEASSSVIGCQPDVLDFDGFGDLFNEPEVSAGPNASDNNTQADEITETGFEVGKSSESDPEEVDNSDSPVSIESCLAYFTKPEHLANEHAWHCENCSRVMQEKRRKSKKKQHNSMLISRVDDRIQSVPSCSANGCPCPSEIRILSNGDIKKDVLSNGKSLQSHNVKIVNGENCRDETCHNAEVNLAVSQSEEHVDTNDVPAGQLQSSSFSKTCCQARISGKANDSCSISDRGKAVCGAAEFKQTKSQLVPQGSEYEESDSEDMNSENVKVKRNATKQILINRAPHILTIHLKRFSQDARGRLSKLNGHVDFRETIDLQPYMDSRCRGVEKSKFRLVGVVEHLGSMRGGHYVAYVRGEKSNWSHPDKENGDFVWYHASDAYVRESSLEEVLRCEAYILFYEKT
ncbi:Ubiquitinyl hydrolase 1 [Bertholletia excelsa]